MNALRQMPLRYKFWAVNGLAFVSVLLLVVVAMALEQRSINSGRQDQARSFLQLWQGGEPPPFGSALQAIRLQPSVQGEQRLLLEAAGPESRWVSLSAMPLLGEDRSTGAWVIDTPESGPLAVVVKGRSFEQIFRSRAPLYALIVLGLMLAVLWGSQRLIHFVEGYQRQLEQLAHYDVLTGLPNRVLARARLEHAMERVRRRGGYLALLFIDLDRFKTLNDSYGHAFGDAVLCAVSRRFKQRCRSEDTLARLGGDEFLLILEQIPTQQTAERVASNLLGLLDTPLELEEGHALYVGASIGIALYPGDGTSAGELIRNADAAMYRAKAQGRNTCAHYLPCLTECARVRFELERALRGALHNNELRVAYQPLGALKSGNCVGAEALLRWHSPVHGDVSPERFIGLAEDSGLIVPIGSWVLRQACQQASHWRQQGLGLQTIAVNLSPIQFLQQDIVQLVSTTLEETGLPADCLELELTEGALMHHTEQAEKNLHALKQLGVRVTIDDFGTGYSSLAYLRRFELDKLKIDKSFMAGVPDNASDCQLAQTIIAMARNMGLKVLAEGVESIEQRDWLQRQGCDQYQGYWLSKALAADDFARWMTASFANETATAALLPG